MPGYGYARAPKAAVKGWTRLIRDYLRGRRELKRVFVLIDARHGIKPNDKETMTLLDEAAVSYQVVLTKADKPKAAELAALKEKIAGELAKHPAAYPRIVTTSARMGSGIDELRAAVAIAIDPRSRARARGCGARRRSNKRAGRNRGSSRPSRSVAARARPHNASGTGHRSP